MSAAERCPWCMGSTLERDYHDQEWGVPQHDPTVLFELLTLEGAQAGLSWRTVLQKREGYRRAFLHYRLPELAALSDADLEQRLSDPSIVRNRLKVWSVRSNAQAVLRLADQGQCLNEWLWATVDDEPQINQWQRMADVPARTERSDALSKRLQKAGFKFVGSTICYAFMQAVGMVNDHLQSCYRYRQLGGR
ncbi:DNA-3-methyladenine glycosylase I [Pseudomarimonas arenosa]|uniref:DNA-3-methyladenine glycosylase I n=1 Tax=Pseudomarimonas arenosa TaxID=2774145 RepID=A0AAW3ZM91_9GAMM|nr:DNA-3-methyladenine glycosylase I [Pseudomarimonas arenosa]MBD8526853.1 DNA-3-methyladenine glycosylase I [Pseudomarimonas arenosa]